MLVIQTELEVEDKVIGSTTLEADGPGGKVPTNASYPYNSYYVHWWPFYSEELDDDSKVRELAVFLAPGEFMLDLPGLVLFVGGQP